jgi:glucokinase
MIGAIDIGGTKIAVGAVDTAGRLLASMETPSASLHSYQDGLAQIVAMLWETERRAGVRLKGIGIGSTGPVYPEEGLFGDLNFLPGWSNQRIVDDLENTLHLPIALENDADAAALGEARWGSDSRGNRLVYVTIGTGIGGGIVLGRELYRGVNGAHPEIGHHVLEANGPQCSCGFRGCWESLAAGPALAQWMTEQCGLQDCEEITASRVCTLARAGDVTAVRAVERETFYLAIGLANLVNIFAPDAIVLSGSLMKSAHLFLPGISEVMHRGCRFVPLASVDIRLASLGEDANLIGAASAWHYRFSSRDAGTPRPQQR